MCRDTKEMYRKSRMVEGPGFVFKDADDGKQQASRIIEQWNVFLCCIEKAVLLGTANGILQSLWS